jgi:hypothetical protein
MPRPDRGVAQRYAAKKRKKRASVGRLPAAAVAPLTRSAAQPGNDPLAGETASLLPPPQRVSSAERPSTISRARTASARPFTSYTNDYRYVLDDLRRVALVAGSLFLALLVLSFFVR